MTQTNLIARPSPGLEHWPAGHAANPPPAIPDAIQAQSSPAPPCLHCGTLCRSVVRNDTGQNFCCHGCRIVFDLLVENGLETFYKLNAAPGVRVSGVTSEEQFRYVNEPDVRQRLVDFSDERLTRVTFRVPAIHCIACVWLLENLFRLKPGIGQSQVHFLRKEVSIAFETGKVALSEIVALLASLGYEPELKLADLDARHLRHGPRRLWMQLGVAGFAFGNTMLFSISSYLGLDGFTGPALQKLVGFISIAMAIPVVAYSAQDYWRSAWISLRQRLLNIDVPIALGIAALFAQSCFEVLSGRGEGYFDSLAGLLFFLLCGKLFQQKSYERLAFDRDYKSFFPLSVTRIQSGGDSDAPTAAPRAEERVSLAQLCVGDHLRLRHGELIPADSRLIQGSAIIDYSFVTGESEPVEKGTGDHLYAGGRQVGGVIEVEIVKAVSQSYLTSLWNQSALRKDRPESLNLVTNNYSQRFTRLVLGIATGAAVVWAFIDPAISVKAFTSVLIVACPCALALAAPFGLGTAQRLLARRNVFLKNPYVVETLARIDAVVFDKTGTLTATGAGAGAVQWHGRPLTERERVWIKSIARHSTHPLAVRLCDAIEPGSAPETIRSFREAAGCGVEADVVGHRLQLGSSAWIESLGVRTDVAPPSVPLSLRGTSGERAGERGAPFPPQSISSSSPHLSPPSDGGAGVNAGSVVHVAIDGAYRGRYVLTADLRPDADLLVQELSKHCQLALLSGDHDRQRERFAALFGEHADLRFNQSPLTKLEFIRDLQSQRRKVMMVGDGLNDAGALRQSDVGVAVVENISAFSPASDVILEASMVPRLANVLRFARQSMLVVRGAFLISTLYNVIGVAIAATGRLSPIVCAILMPLSSVTVVAFACGATAWLGRRALSSNQPALKTIPNQDRARKVQP